MNSLIIGSGFGFYGYLPSIYSFSKKIFIDKKYKQKYLNLKILKRFSFKIFWYKNLYEIIEDVDYLVIALEPSKQVKILKNIFTIKKKFKHIFLEKPINNNPNNSLMMIRYLKKKGANYSIGFIFEYLKWIKFLRTKKKRENFKIVWTVKKKNFSNSWKYNLNKGGGLIRYYGIHFLRIFKYLKYDKIQKNFYVKDKWDLTVKNKLNITINLIIKYSKNDKFLLKKGEKEIIISSNPFLKDISKYQPDPRINFLKEYIINQIYNYKDLTKDYIDLMSFWAQIEKTINQKN